MTDGVDLDEELLDGAEDDGCLRAPAVRILVDVFFVAEDRALRSEDLDDALVAGEDVLAHELGQSAFGGVFAIGIDGRKDIEPVLASGLVVVRAVAGSDVDCAGAGVVGDEEGVDDLRRSCEEGVLRCTSIQGAAFESVIRM